MAAPIRTTAKASVITNEKLDELLVAQNRTNQLLEWIGTMIHEQQQV